MKRIFYLFLFVGMLLCRDCLSSETKKTADTSKQMDVGKEDFDEFDFMIEEAFGRGISEEELKLEAPTKIQMMIRKIAAPFVGLFVYTVLKYRILCKFFARKCRCMRGLLPCPWFFRSAKNEPIES